MHINKWHPVIFDFCYKEIYQKNLCVNFFIHDGYECMLKGVFFVMCASFRKIYLIATVICTMHKKYQFVLEKYVRTYICA